MMKIISALKGTLLSLSLPISVFSFVGFALYLAFYSTSEVKVSYLLTLAILALVIVVSGNKLEAMG